MTSITLLFLDENVNVDAVAIEIGSLLIEQMGFSKNSIKCVSLNESEILEMIGKESVKVASTENIATNSIYQALVFLNRKYGLNIRYSLDKFINDITNDLLTVVFKPEEKLLQDEKALRNAVKIIGESSDEEIKKYLHQAKVFEMYIAPIKRVYKLL